MSSSPFNIGKFFELSVKVRWFRSGMAIHLIEWHIRRVGYLLMLDWIAPTSALLTYARMVY